MGMHFYSYVFYGFQIGNEQDDFYDLMDSIWNEQAKVLISSAGDGEPYFVYVKESMIRTGGYAEEPSFQPLPTANFSDWDYELYQFCLEHELNHLQPCWTFASGYS